MLYTLTTISVWFTDIHSNCQSSLPSQPSTHTHTHDSYLLLWHMCAGVCVCVLVVLSRTCIRQLVVQFIQYINFNNMWVHTPEREVEVGRGEGPSTTISAYCKQIQLAKQQQQLWQQWQRQWPEQWPFDGAYTQYWHWHIIELAAIAFAFASIETFREWSPNVLNPVSLNMLTCW